MTYFVSSNFLWNSIENFLWWIIRSCSLIASHKECSLLRKKSSFILVYSSRKPIFLLFLQFILKWSDFLPLRLYLGRTKHWPTSENNITKMNGITKLSQNVCPINTHILMYRYAWCNCKLCKALWLSIFIHNWWTFTSD